MKELAGLATCGIIVVFPAASYAGVVHVGPVLSVMLVISLTVLVVRAWFRLVVPDAFVTKPDQLPVGSSGPSLLECGRPANAGLGTVECIAPHVDQAVEVVIGVNGVAAEGVC